jgi:hypothetical protein
MRGSMNRNRRAAFTVAALLTAGTLVPVASTPAQAEDTTVTISGIAFDPVEGVPVDRIDVLYADPQAYVPAKDLVKGPSLGRSDIAADGHFTLSVPSGKAFYLRLIENSPEYLEETFVGAGGATSSAYLTLHPIVTTADLDLGCTNAIRAATVRISTNLASPGFALLKLDGSEAYSELAQPSETSHTISGVAPGRYRVSVSDRYLVGETISPSVITVPAGSDVAVTVTQSRFAKLTGQVLTPAGKPLKDVGVTAHGPGSARDVDRVTDKYGRYSLTGLKAGTYTVSYLGVQDSSAAAYLGKTRTVSVRAGESRSLKPVTLTKGGVVAASVPWGETNGLGVYLLSKSGTVVSGDDGVSSETSHTRSWRTRGVRTGTYTLLVELNGRYLKKKVTVKAGAVTKLGLLHPGTKPRVVTGTIPSAHGGWITVYSKHSADERGYRAYSRIGSTGRFTLHVVPGTWFVHVKGGSEYLQVGSRIPRRVKITGATRTLTVPVRKLTMPVTSSVTYRGKPIFALFLRTLNPRQGGEEFFANNFTTDDVSARGEYLGSWGVDTRPSVVHVYEDAGLLPTEGPYYFVTTVAKVRHPRDVKHLSVVVTGGA